MFGKKMSEMIEVSHTHDEIRFLVAWGEKIG